MTVIKIKRRTTETKGQKFKKKLKDKGVNIKDFEKTGDATYIELEEGEDPQKAINEFKKIYKNHDIEVTKRKLRGRVKHKNDPTSSYKNVPVEEKMRMNKAALKHYGQVAGYIAVRRRKPRARKKRLDDMEVSLYTRIPVAVAERRELLGLPPP